MSNDLIQTARRLAKASPRRPRQADLKRAVSTAYYAVFHAIARDAADLLAGKGADRPDKAWLQTYRALEHGFASSACKQVISLGFPDGIVTCARLFVDLQQRRHDADYNPLTWITRSEAMETIDQAEFAISSLRATSRRDRRAFAIQILLRRRG